MEAYLVSAGVVAVAEIGDKTQLLALVLATRFRKPVPIILGILAATLANHLLAAWVGALVAGWLGDQALRVVVGVSFLLMAGWVLVPDKDDDDAPRPFERFGPFVATLVAFFLVEIGDKTQIATVALAARFNDVLWVTAGTTTGMMLADVPAVFVGQAAAHKIPLGMVRAVAAAVFAVLGVLALGDAAGISAALTATAR
ncbi:MAG: TMEM165/GDT1 family protein [Actinomycetota bacterium]